MNICALSGIAASIYYDTIKTHDGGKQPFLAFLLRLQGPHKEGPSTARIVVYGQNARKYYPLLHEGQWVEVTGRYRNNRWHQGDKIYEFVVIRVDFKHSPTRTSALEEFTA